MVTKAEFLERLRTEHRSWRFECMLWGAREALRSTDRRPCADCGTTRHDRLEYADGTVRCAPCAYEHHLPDCQIVHPGLQ